MSSRQACALPPPMVSEGSERPGFREAAGFGIDVPDPDCYHALRIALQQSGEPFRPSLSMLRIPLVGKTLSSPI